VSEITPLEAALNYADKHKDRTWHDEHFRVLAAEVRSLRSSLRDAGDLLFGTWDDDSTGAERHQKAEIIIRTALGEEPPKEPEIKDAPSDPYLWESGT